MNEIEQVLFDLVEPMVNDVASLSVKVMPSLNDNEILLYVYAKSEDVARLIGKRGMMATAIRQMMTVASRVKNKRVSIKFESY
jgi:Predicted RNA-binding protein (contains KH domain)